MITEEITITSEDLRRSATLTLRQSLVGKDTWTVRFVRVGRRITTKKRCSFPNKTQATRAAKDWVA